MTAKDNIAGSDHDLLIELRASTTQNFQYIRDDIKSLKDGTHAQLTDHEQRLRAIEAGFVTNAIYGPAHQNLIKQLDTMKKYIWMGLGIVSALVLIINVAIRFIK